MRVERFKASNIQEALKQVKETLGPEAVILHTRSVPKDNVLGLARSKNIEVIAALDRPSGNGRLWPQIDKQVEQNKYESKREFSKLLDNQMASSTDKPLWLKSEQQLNELKKEVGELKRLLRQREQSSVGKMEQKNDFKEKPQAKLNHKALFSQINDWLKKQGVGTSIADTVVIKVRKRFESENITLAHKVDIEKMYQFFCEEIADLIPTLKKAQVSTKPKVVAFVGPPGSGKSSACAKIAVKNAYLFGKKVALILANMSPNGVTQHLASVANIAQLPLAVVQTSRELEATIAAHQDKDLILIDFAGNNKCGVSRVAKLNRLVSVAAPHETHLVLPANLKATDALAIASKFYTTNFDRVIFSKIDETVSIGSLVEIIQQLGKPISYFSTGPIIPDDIEPASGFKLANMILRG